jgi:hypothetical protein
MGHCFFFFLYAVFCMLSLYSVVVCFLCFLFQYLYLALRFLPPFKVIFFSFERCVPPQVKCKVAPPEWRVAADGQGPYLPEA